MTAQIAQLGELQCSRFDDRVCNECKSDSVSAHPHARDRYRRDVTVCVPESC